MLKTIRALLYIYLVSTVMIILWIILGQTVPMWVTPLLTLIAFAFALSHGSVYLGWKPVLGLLGITFGVGLLSESLGVLTGWVYGAYHYTERLGPLFLGLVPYLIPVAWFMMIYPSYVIADQLIPAQESVRHRFLWVAALGAVIMTSWDLVMDPLMVAGKHWIWETPGVYFGIPLQNYRGWWATAFIVFTAFGWYFRERIGPQHPSPKFTRLATLSYAITGSSNVITAWVSGLGGPALAGFFAMVPWVLMSLFISRFQSQRNPTNEEESVPLRSHD
jgi:putative membrane protein